MTEKVISQWASTAAVQSVPCPRCHASTDQYCRTPKGRKAKDVHTERMLAYRNFIGTEEYTRRHSRPIKQSLADILRKL